MNTLKDLISGAGCAADGSATMRNPLGNVVNQLMESVPTGMGMGMGMGRAGTMFARTACAIVVSVVAVQTRWRGVKLPPQRSPPVSLC
jgi:hypothetical protein